MPNPEHRKEHKAWKWVSYFRAILLTSFTFVIVVFVARALDFVKIEVNQMFVSGNALSERHFLRYGSRTGEQIIGTDDLGTILTASGEVALKYNKETPGFSTGGHDDLIVAIGEKLRRENMPSLKVTVDSLKAAGPYWTPLIKQGTTSFVVSIDHLSPEIEYSAHFNGEIQVKIYGFSNSSEVNRASIDRISYLVVKTVKTDFAGKNR